MPGFGKAGISFLICIRLSFALLDQGQKATFAGKKQKCGTLLDSKVENLCPANLYIHPIKSGKENLFLKDSLVYLGST